MKRDNTINTISVRLKEIREQQGMSISDLSEKSGISISYIGRLENGSRKNPSAHLALRISQALGVRVEELVEDHLAIIEYKDERDEERAVLDVKKMYDSLTKADKKKLIKALLSDISQTD